ncbi:hypothetical protein QBC32DRAFT_387117 [Pseudoneurospora amorphoporcata]|uniref:Uncharacterized protein n=1 Tax=Pseudoneurospora amorphoporcata TaxID=241081 RepID=A0AAN6NJE0_9PEZI|nr:hypothetical protein QBC32DRAFT_387117 [Pseudoneurospora amorphoporcata]
MSGRQPLGQPPNVSDSWRQVEVGENDSFDTSLMPDDYNCNDIILSSQSDDSHTNGSQPFSLDGSQPFSIGGSQDESLESFLHKAEQDGLLIRRTPFAPSIPQSIRHASRQYMGEQIQPAQAFYIPIVDLNSRPSNTPRTLIGSREDPHSLDEDTAINADIEERVEGMKRSRIPKRQPALEIKGFFYRFFNSIPNAIFNTLSRALGVVRFAFRYTQKPIAILASVYLIFSLLSIVQNMATLSLYTALSPIFRVPDAKWFNLPFYLDTSTKTNAHIKLDSVIEIQDRFEGVLEKAAESASLPLEMKRSELAIRGLRTVVLYRQLHGREQLILEFDGYIDAASSATWDLQMFNTHVGSTIDFIISVSQWTSRYIDELSDDIEHHSIIGKWWDWVFSSFQPTTNMERKLSNQYIDHTIEDHLEIIYDFVTRAQEHIQAKKEEVFWLWTYIGFKSGNAKSYNNQLALISKVEDQCSEAVKQVSELIVQLQNIQASFNRLRDRVDVDVEIIERLKSARNKIRDTEIERVREALARGKEQLPELEAAAYSL